jgi:hypothetical protein
MTRAQPSPDFGPAAAAKPHGRRWLLFVHQLPSSPSNIRVRTWRRLKQIGAVIVKQAVYALPDSPATREDFEWLKAEIEGDGGEAEVFAAAHLESDDALVEEFRQASQDAYTGLAAELEQATGRRTRSRRGRAQSPRRLLQAYRERFAAIERIDFFGSAGRDRVAQLLETLADRFSANPTRSNGDAREDHNATAYRGRVWVTRPRPGVDRMASAWLIRRFIDADARFGFASDRDAAGSDPVPFDMFGVEFSHRGGLCTFETLCHVFRLDDPAVGRVAGVVHDLDLKDGRFGAPEAAAIGGVIEGLQAGHADDHQLLEAGITLFDALYRGFVQSARGTGPRPVARRRTRGRRKKPR